MKKLIKYNSTKNSAKSNEVRPQSSNGKPVSPPPVYTEVTKGHSETQRTEQRNKEATEQLKAALMIAQGTWKGFQSYNNGIPEDIDPSQIREAINEFFASQDRTVKSKTRWAKCKDVVERVYTAVSPFLKNLLVIVTQGSGFNPYSMITQAVWTLMVIADHEIARVTEIEFELDYISRQLGQLEVTEELPNAGVPSYHLINSAMEVHSAVMTYLAVLIRYESKAGGIVGKVVTAFVKGNEDRESATHELETAIEDFNKAFFVYAHRVNLKTFTHVQDIKLQLLANAKPPPVSCILSRFLVPYDQNPHFVGRTELRKTLREKLVTVGEKQYNHRVALYGLGGVGKTQTALAYVYAHRSDYDAIYWITGVNQASLLSGFQDIAKAGGLQGTHEMGPTDVAKVVIEWLRSQDNWLLVIDNLDDFDVARQYLPPREVSKHTIITTRNPNFIDIPAEGIEISTLDPKDAIELLLLRSFGPKVPAKFDPDKVQAEAAEVVEKLGYLALAIEQAAAFIRETSKDIFRFLPSYMADRKKHHKRVPRGNWEYPHPVSSTWHLSFQKVKEGNEVASELLKLFAFLNPDGILREFLEAGRDGLPDSLGELIGDEDEYYGALNELVRFSLIRREDDKDEETVTMHRLVQAVIKDEMEDEHFSAMTEAVLSLCDHAFPHTWEGEGRSVCRKYQEQVLAMLSEVKDTESDVLLRLIIRVAWFLQEDGKYAQAVELQTKIIEVSTARNGPDHEDTLTAMTRLATAYRYQKRWDEAIRIQEKVYETNRTKFGDDHLNTWGTMGDLAATYRSKGRRQDAVGMQEKVLKARQKLLGEDHPDTIRAMGNLAATYRNQRRCTEAARYQEEVLKFRQKTLGDDHPETMRAMINLAATYRFQNRAHLGAPLEEKVVTYRLQYWGVEHPQTLIALRNLAESYSYLKRWDDACSLQETVLETRKKVFGVEDSETVWAMSNLSDMYRRRGNVEEACKLLERVLEIRRRVLGDVNHETISAMEKLVKSYESLGRQEEATRLKAESMSARRAISIAQRSRNFVPPM